MWGRGEYVGFRAALIALLGYFAFALTACSTYETTSAARPTTTVHTTKTARLAKKYVHHTSTQSTNAPAPGESARTPYSEATTPAAPLNPKTSLEMQANPRMRWDGDTQTMSKNSEPQVNWSSGKIKDGGGRLYGRPFKADDDQFDTVTVLWGTTRKISASDGNNGHLTTAQFTSSRSEKLTTGYAKVTVPKNANRQVGQIPRPTEFAIVDFTLYKAKEDPRKHFTVSAISELDAKSLAAMSRNVSSKSERFKGQAFVYVHGFWNTFDDSLFRTAQLAYDMGFDGVPYLFAWPSKGSELGYLYDRDSADESQKAFLDFLNEISTQDNITKIHIIAHSMGSRIVVDTLFPSVGEQRLSSLPKLNQVVLAAPDVDSSIMRARAAAFKPLKTPVTLYACNNDGALINSRRFAGNQPRAGDVMGGKHLILDGIETIDISAMGGTFVFLGENHSNYAEKAHVLKDLALLMEKGVHPPKTRFPVYDPHTEAGGTYWSYVNN